MFRVTFHAYCGMSFPVLDGADRDEAIATVRRRIRSAKRNGRTVSKIGKGEWEFETPEDAAGIADSDGILTVRRVHRRRGNGQQFRR
jgi:hypothetical protein